MPHCAENPVGKRGTGVVFNTFAAENLTLHAAEKKLAVRFAAVAAGDKVGHVSGKGKQAQFNDGLYLRMRSFVVGKYM